MKRLGVIAALIVGAAESINATVITRSFSIVADRFETGRLISLCQAPSALRSTMPRP